MLGIAICLAALVLSTFISNSAATNLLAPDRRRGGAASTAPAPSPSVVFVALGASMAMALPISTPPNAIAYSDRHVHHQADGRHRVDHRRRRAGCSSTSCRLLKMAGVCRSIAG